MVTSELLAYVGAATGAISLTWNVTAFLLTGSRVSVETRTGYSKDELPAYRAKDGSELIDPLGEAFIIRVINKGRLAINVDAFEIVTPVRRSYLALPPFSGDLPFRVEPHASYEASVGMGAIRARLRDYFGESRTASVRFRVVVKLGNGKVVKTRRVRFYDGSREWMNPFLPRARDGVIGPHVRR